ncbi:hypothetical protein [Gorillibacterium timonense]|uniref:hypothetical protein n=1 Tax=Gorillibacterium timonense TaxID=1689269 RepID=UPI00071C8176|nr:hypothetical protein [Gorillibacterium timonense]
MSKLDGNERWNSKMLLTEHQEQYEHRKDRKKSGPPETEELEMLRNFILLPHLLTLVERNRQDIERSTMALKKLYLASTQLLLDEIGRDLHQLKRELALRSIKVVGEEQTDMVYYYHYVCRGYEDRFGIVREVMKAQLSVMLGKYLSHLLALMKKGWERQEQQG